MPDDYIRKMKQDLAESDKIAESSTRYEPFADDEPTPPSDDDQSP